MKDIKNLIVFILLTVGLAVAVPLAMFLFLKLIASGGSISDANCLFYSLMFLAATIVIASSIILWKLITVKKELSEIKKALDCKTLD
jgi:hypothetical protein